MEYVDIVDEQNKVTGKCSKEEAHKKGLLHRTVVAEVFNSKGEWLLVRQAGHKQDAGQFVSPVGGHVAAGETVTDALKREVFEEIGIKKFTHKLKGKTVFDRISRGVRENHLFILYEIRSDEEPVLNDESVGYERFSIKKLKLELDKNPKKFGHAFHVVINTFYKKL